MHIGVGPPEAFSFPPRLFRLGRFGPDDRAARLTRLSSSGRSGHRSVSFGSDEQCFLQAEGGPGLHTCLRPADASFPLASRLHSKATLPTRLSTQQLTDTYPRALHPSLPPTETCHSRLLHSCRQVNLPTLLYPLRPVPPAALPRVLSDLNLAMILMRANVLGSLLG